MSFVAGLSPSTLNAILHRVGTLEVLLEKSEAELRALLPLQTQPESSYDEEEARRLVRAMNSLRQCRRLMDGHGSYKDVELYWDSWDSRHSGSASGGHHYHHQHHHNQHHHSRGVSAAASPRTTRSHRHHQQQQLSQVARVSTTTSGITAADGNHSGVQSPVEASPPESYNNSQSSTSAAVQSPAEESSTMSTNLTPSPSPPMSPLSLQQQQQALSSTSLNNSSGNNNSSQSSIPGGVMRSAGRQSQERHPLTPQSRLRHQGQGQTIANSPVDCGAPTTTLSSDMPPTWTGTNCSSSSCSSNGGNGGVCNNNNNNHGGQPQSVIMTKSRSHESQLVTTESMSTQDNSNGQVSGNGQTTQTLGNSTASNGIKTPRSRLHTEPGPDPVNDIFNEKPATAVGNHHHHHNNNNNNNNYNHSLTVPRSPLTPNSTTNAGTTNTAPTSLATLNHDIPHHFTKNFKLTTVTCNFCNRQMFYGLKCKECKYRCHKECEPQVPSSCGLPQQVFDMINSSPNMNRTGVGGGSGGHHSRRANQELLKGTGGHGSNLIMTGSGADGRGSSGGIGGGPDSSSAGSSCNSSSPSSPALLLSSSSSNHYHGSHLHQPHTPQQGGGGGGFGSHQKSQFSFPEVATVVNVEDQTLYKNSEMVNSNISVLSDYRPPNSPRITFTADEEAVGSDGEPLVLCQGQYYNGVGSADESVQSPLLQSNGNGTSTVDSGGSAVNQPSTPGRGGHEMTHEEKTGSTMSGSSTNTGGSSTDSERTPVRLDSTEERDSMPWPRQNSLSLKEWDIPYDDLRLLEQLGKGRFGTVHRALWHGDVAVKLLKEDYLDDERTLEAFKLEVAIFKKTRHENVVLFMGACMKPPRLAIVTSLCKGKTLYTHIYVCRDKFNLNKATMVAQQISQGMGYLHARGIVHKDLRTKNIFLENGKVIITDFGLFSAKKLLYCDRGVEVQENWLCYLAPELMRGLKPQRVADEDLCFSRASDVYAFGTVWYELLCGEFPYRKVPAESVIWQVGRGMKPTLANLQAPRDVKDILMVCWAFQADDRKDFAALLGLLERLPKKRLARSPSHPVQLSKSAESVF